MNALFEWLLSVIKELQPWLIVQPWERAIRTRLGRNPIVLDAGIHWKLPLTDSVFVINSRQRAYPFPSQTLWSKDGKSITAAGLVIFRVSDPFEAHMAMKEPEMICAAFAQAAITEYVSTHDLSEMRVEELRQYVLDALGAVPGVAFDDVTITEFGAFRTIRLLQEQWRPETSLDVTTKAGV